MIVFPNAKINLGLAVTGKREDGFHNIETVFFPINLKDSLEVTHAESGDTTLQVFGDAETGPPHKNLVFRAYAALKKDFPELPAVDIALLKQIPSGGGLGGGSSDAAFMLQLLNEMFELNISEEKLKHYALDLGSDCPFFLVNAPMLATGRGEDLKPITVDLSTYKIVLVCPGIHVSTAAAFNELHSESFSDYGSVSSAIITPVSEWKAQLKNDFEKSVFHQFPALAAIKSRLYEAGAIYAAMSGSGSSIFGLFPADFDQNISFEEGYRVYLI